MTQRTGVGSIVSYKQHSHTVCLANFSDIVSKRSSHNWIKCRKRFIKQQNFGVVGESARESDPLLLST
jgi:hypothetical protein